MRPGLARQALGQERLGHSWRPSGKRNDGDRSVRVLDNLPNADDNRAGYARRNPAGRRCAVRIGLQTLVRYLDLADVARPRPWWAVRGRRDVLLTVPAEG